MTREEKNISSLCTTPTILGTVMSALIIWGVTTSSIACPVDSGIAG